MIDSYDFGLIIINGKRYNSDLMIFSDKVKAGWWRKEGHRLQVEDLRDVLEVKPEVLVVGTGYSGLIRIPPETRKYVESEGIEFIAQRTAKACETFNRLVKSRKVVAALHLTC
jgi:hypothetical protein